MGFGYRSFSGVTDGENTESDNENVEGDNGSVGTSKADLEEVNRVCKVVEELFVLDRNMEAVLSGCGVNLTLDLVVDVLDRFKHARRPAFRFFCWAGEQPGFEHDSRTYNKMMEILGKTRQFETMVAVLEEMGGKGLLTMETFEISMKAFTAAKERKKAAKLGKEAQILFERLKERFSPNLQTYTVLLNGWCRVKNLMEAGRVWNEMIDMGFKPDIVAHNTMFEGLLKGKKKSDAIKLFEVMKASR
ncbi:hypothetical protein RJ640_020005, partial [Escallonia rubra]